MSKRFQSATLAMLLLASLAGCRGPTWLFSGIDRNCFVADWMNDHASCVSCIYCANHCSRPTVSKIRPPIPAPEEKTDNTAALRSQSPVRQAFFLPTTDGDSLSR
jgi:hypothetical protein